MRIIGGKDSGRILVAPKGLSIRPTADRVREAIFNRLSPYISNARVLDLFSGTGALGLECISRGASTVLSVENSNQHFHYIKKNIRSCRYQPNQIQVRLACAFKTIHDLASHAETFDIILADPPYGPKTKTAEKRSESLAQQLMDNLNLPRLATPYAVVVIGHTTRDKVKIHQHWLVEKTQQYGDATIRWLKRNLP